MKEYLSNKLNSQPQTINRQNLWFSNLKKKYFNYNQDVKLLISRIFHLAYCRCYYGESSYRHITINMI